MRNFTKYKTNGGIEFFYNNQSNTLHETDGSIITISGLKEPDHNYFRFAEDNYGSRKKSNTPVALRIMMGHACNYSCSYCMQKDIGNPNERPLRDNLDIFFDRVRENLDLSKLERVELWGGEPFLYWNDMMRLMEFFDNEKVHFFISTNGSALSKKHADFFEKLKSTILLSISHDAVKQQALRGDEIFTRERVIETLKRFDGMTHVTYGFTCSITNTNYDLFEINDFFRDKILHYGLRSYNLAFSLGRGYTGDESKPSEALPCNIIDGDIDKSNLDNSYTHVIHGENLEKFRKILRDFLEAHYQQYLSFGFEEDGTPKMFKASVEELPFLITDIYEGHMAYSVFAYGRKVINGEPILETTNCGADMKDILSMDLDANIRTCPHVNEGHIMGNLNNLKGIRIVPLNLKRKDEGCSSCHNLRLCRSSCPINLPEEVFKTNCRIEKIWYGEIQKAAFRLIFNDKVEMVETALENPFVCNV